MPTHLAAFVATVALLAMLPGANNASITRQTLLAGRRAGMLTVAGSSTGILVCKPPPTDSVAAPDRPAGRRRSYVVGVAASLGNPRPACSPCR